MTTTTNLKLKKPAQTDGVNIDDINGNMEILDGAVKVIQDKFTADGKAVNADKLDGKDSTEFAPASHTHTPEQADAAPASHVADSVIHVTAADKTNWSGKADGDVTGKALQAINSQKLNNRAEAEFCIRASNVISGTVLSNINSLITQGFKHATFGVADFSMPDAPYSYDWGTVEYIKSASGYIKVFWYREGNNAVFVRTMTYNGIWHTEWAEIYTSDNKPYYSGTYVGDGAATKYIDLNAQFISWVQVATAGSDYLLGGSPLGYGFEVRANRGANTNGTTYNYIAFK